MLRLAGIAVLLLVIAAVAGFGPAAIADGGGDVYAAAHEHDSLTQQLDVDADAVRIGVDVRDDGSAAWTIEFLVLLDDEKRAEAFESVRADIDEDPDGHVAEFADRIETTVATASEATNREMAADDFAVETERRSLDREYGVVTYSFEWHGFGDVRDDEIHVGDAVDGMYLEDETRLLIAWPEDYDLASVSPEPDDERDHGVIWYGSETDFVTGEPRVVVSPASLGLGWVAIGGSLIAAALLLGSALWWLRSRSSDDERPESIDHPDVETPSPAGSTTGPSTDQAPDPTSSQESEPSTGQAPAPSTHRSPDELLSNEEQVLALLDEQGGRMKQQTIVEELGWTDAKTSKVVKGMREEGTLESFRIGRENVLTYPDDDTESAEQSV